MVGKEFTQKEVIELFEKSWSALVKKYHETRVYPAWCSEADIQLYISHKLLGKLPSERIHLELPIPLEVERFSEELYTLGRVSARKCIKPDIVVIDPETLLPNLIAEIKFTPLYWGFLPLVLAVTKKMTMEKKERIKKVLKHDISYFKRVQERGPSTAEMEKVYTKNLEKLITIINHFEKKMKTVVAGYLCVVDECYPDLEERLKKEFIKYNPPSQFRILVEHYPALDVLERTLATL